jgi:hypothetical protein
MNLPILLKQLLPRTADAPAASQPAHEPDVAHKPRKRTKLWELHAKHHCPVTGTCLNKDELVKFSRRFSLGVPLGDEFAMHVAITGRLDSRNDISETLHKHLDRKYQVCLARFEQAKTDDAVLTLWQVHRANGEMAAALWSALTHKSASEDTRQAIYAEMHMLSHQMTAGRARDARLLNSLEKEHAETKSALEQERQERTRIEAGLRERIRLQEAGRGALQAEVVEMHAMRMRLTALESGKTMMDMGQNLMKLIAANEQLRAQAEQRWALEKTLQAARNKLQELSGERDQLLAECDALQRLLPLESADQESCAGQCSSCDHAMQGKCVLYVGGRSSSLAQYRALAERLGIRLTHHDGGLEESISRLPDMINSADAVVCPTDCVSHNAYYQLKRQCQRDGKPCVLFKGTGVSSFAAALASLTSLPLTHAQPAP